MLDMLDMLVRIWRSITSWPVHESNANVSRVILVNLHARKTRSRTGLERAKGQVRAEATTCTSPIVFLNLGTAIVRAGARAFEPLTSKMTLSVSD